MQQQVDYIENEAVPEWLKPLLVPGSTVYTKVDHVSRSGMSRVISAYVVDNGEIRDISYYVSEVLGWKRDKNHYGVKVGGCGMDMGFHMVYSFSRRLYPNGFHCVGDKCPSNDHFNGEDNEVHSDGGYALKQRWL